MNEESVLCPKCFRRYEPDKGCKCSKLIVVKPKSKTTKELIAEAVKQEREACACLVEDASNCDETITYAQLADAIRGRKNEGHEV